MLTDTNIGRFIWWAPWGIEKPWRFQRWKRKGGCPGCRCKSVLLPFLGMFHWLDRQEGQ